MRFSRLRLSASLLLLLVAFSACGNPQEEARLKLGQMKLDYNENTFVRVAQDGDLEAVQAFLQAGMKPDATDKEGQIALLAASRFGREPVVKALLAAGADPNLKDARFGGTPLQWAAVGGFAGIVNLLLDKGADIKARDTKNGMTALISATMAGKTEVIKILLDHEAEINAGDNDSRTALMWAARKGQVEAAKLLLERGADPKLQEKIRGWNPLITASEAGKAKVVKVLLNQGADPNVPDKLGRTALMYAAQNGQKDVVELLLAHKANLNAQDREGHTALSLARSYHQQEVAEMLKKAGAPEGTSMESIPKEVSPRSTSGNARK